MEQYLVYTNITGSSDVPKIEQYLSTSGYNFVFETIYHTHHVIDHTKFKKCFALVDTSCPIFSQEQKEEVLKRCRTLISKGFRIVACNFWESKDQISKSPWTKLLKSFEPLIWHGGVTFFWYLMFERYKDHKFKFNHTEKKYDFLYLNKLARSHRKRLFDKFLELNILDNSLYSFIDRGIRLPQEYELPGLKEYPQYGEDRTIFEKQFNHTKFNIVSETSDTERFFTEKIWKPIIAKQIFIVHAMPDYLVRLRLCGFQTFSDQIDESYDTLENGNQRILSIVSLCESLKGRKHHQLYYDTQSIRDHNQKTFFDFEILKKNIRNDVAELLELVDGSEISS